jgi:small glutamine-rich tetratricopeptide repeat-containing protein alpha
MMDTPTAFAVCEALAAELAGGALAPAPAAAVEVALTALQTAYQVDVTRAEQRSQWSLRTRGLSLPAVLELARTHVPAASAAPTPTAPAAAAAPATVPAAATATDKVCPWTWGSVPAPAPYRRGGQAGADEAETHKAAGNVAMKDKRYDAAVSSYSRAIELDPSVAVYFANRHVPAPPRPVVAPPHLTWYPDGHSAAAYLCVRDNAAAVADCETAIRLDPAYAKAYSRLGCVCVSQRHRPRTVD